MIRFAKITQVDGAKFIIRVTGENSTVIAGYEVDKDGEEISPNGFDRRMRIVQKDCIKKSVEMRMNNTYATLEKV